jgi:proteasome lid subunit RPN8/RPN11
MLLCLPANPQTLDHLNLMIAITRTAYLIMLAHCQSVYPLEACGFLGGIDGKAFSVTAVENALHSPVAYEMEPIQQLEAMLDLERSGLEMVAAYHSHPHGPARPSVTDMAQAYYPDLPQVIVSLRTRSAPTALAFLLTPDTVQKIELRVV